jgi:hypothetical protein
MTMFSGRILFPISVAVSFLPLSYTPLHRSIPLTTTVVQVASFWVAFRYP